MPSANTTKKAALGERLKALRKAKGLSQTELSNLVGVHYTHIGRYEKSQSQPSTNTLSKLADALETTTDYLLEGATEKLVVDRLSDRELLKQFQAAEKLPDKDKAAIKDFIDAYVKRHHMHEMMAG